jgi:hypothetical protein
LFSNEEQEALFELINGISERTVEKIYYLDKHKLLKSEIDAEKFDAVHFQWFLTEAFWLEYRQNLTEEHQKLLDQLMLQGYRKATGFMQAKAMGILLSPFLTEESEYHRHDQPQITQNCYDAYAKDLNFNGDLFVVHSPLMIEAIRREMPDPGGYKIESFDDIENLPSRINEFLELDPNAEDYPAYIDISQLMLNENIKPSEMGEVTSRINDALSLNDLSYVSGNIQVLAFIKHREQDVLLLPRTSSHASIVAILNQTGFRLSPSQTLEAWLKVADVNTLLNEASIPKAKLVTQGKKAIPILCRTYQEFVAQPLQEKFADLAKQSTPYLQVLAQSTSSLIRGLAESDIDGKYPNEMKDLLQISYFRIFNAMQEAILRKDEFLEFYNQVEIIHQELQNMLFIAKPYVEDDFAKSVIANLSKHPAIIPADLSPKVHMKNSGLHAMASILAAVEAQKGSKKINAMLLKDCYFETAQILDGAPEYTTHVLTTEGTYQHECTRGTNGNEPIDLYICEFQHNISIERSHYEAENILEHIKYLKKEKLLAPKFTVAIDTTINLERAENLRKLYADPVIKKMINKGRLNIVLFRSAQKFDMLGLDNYYGGLTITTNNHTFDKFDERLAVKQDQVTGLSYQGLTHLQKFGDLDEYRQAIHMNSIKLYQLLPKDCLFGKQPFINIATMDKECRYFISLKFANATLASHFKSKLIEYAEANNLPLSERRSFGFPNTNITDIGEEMLRLNPGLDDEHSLQLYAKFFHLIADIVNSALEKQQIDNLTDDQVSMNIVSLMDQMSFSYS